MRPDPQREIRTFDRVYADELPYVWSCLRSLGVAPQDLEDAAQDVFVVVHRRLPEFRGEARLRTWLFSIAVRVASRRRRDGFRAERRRQALTTRVIADDGPVDPEEAVARRRATARLERFAATLDADKQRVFELWALEGRSPQDIADALELPRNTVYSRLRVVRQSFSELCAHHHARDEARMSPRRRQQREAAQARIRAAIVVGPLAGGPAASQAPWWARLGTLGGMRALEVGAVVGLATATILVLGAIAPAEPEPRSEPTIARAREPATMPGRPSPAPAPVEPATSIGLPSTAPVPVPVEPTTTPVVHSTAPSVATKPPAPHPRIAPTSSAAPTASPSFDLERAVAQIHAARDALAAGELSAATHALQQHAREFPHGPLEPERDAYAAMIACARGDVAQSQRFVAARPGTRLAQRVSAACAAHDGSTTSPAGGHEESNEDLAPRMDPVDAAPHRRL